MLFVENVLWDKFLKLSMNSEKMIINFSTYRRSICIQILFLNLILHPLSVYNFRSQLAWIDWTELWNRISKIKFKTFKTFSKSLNFQFWNDEIDGYNFDFIFLRKLCFWCCSKTNSREFMGMPYKLYDIMLVLYYIIFYSNTYMYP